MLSEADVLEWQGRFARQLPFRKLKKLITSLGVNMWYAQLHAHGFLPQACSSVRDLMVYDLDDLWEHINNDWSLRSSHQGFTAFSYAKMLPTVFMFRQQAEVLVGDIGQQEKLQDIWHRYGGVLEQGFGLQTPGMTC